MMVSIVLLAFFTAFGTLPSFSKNMSGAMYMNMENKISLHLNGCSAEDITIKITPGNVFKRDDSTYVYIPQIETEELKLKLYYKKVLCEMVTVSVSKLPEIMPVFEAEKGGVIKKGDLNKIGKLIFNYPANYPEDLKSELYSCSVMISASSGSVLYSGNIRGNSFDENVLTIIGKLNKGSKIIISNIIIHNLRTGHQRLNPTKEIVIED